jgi:hypothetical protein
MPRLRPVLAAALLGLVLLPGAARADWGSAIPLAPAGQPRELLALAAADGDRPVVLLQHFTGPRATAITLRTGSASGRMGPERTVAAPAHLIQTAALATGAGDDLVAGWIEKIDGVDQAVVVSGPRLADRQLLTLPSGPRTIESMILRTDRRGDAVVAFWRLHVAGYEVWTSYRPAGGRFGTPQLLTSGAEQQMAAAIDEHGAATVGWLQGKQVEVAQRPAGSIAFGTPMPTPARPRTYSELTLAAAGGRTVLAWAAGNHLAQSVAVSEQPRPGQPFAAARILTAPGQRVPSWSEPRVAISGARTLVAWIQMRDRIGTEHAALAMKDGDGAWTKPRAVAVPAPSHVIACDVLPGPSGRPPLLAVMTSRAMRSSGGTATVRPDGSLSPLRLPAGAVGIGSFPLVAQGAHHAWMGVRRIAGDVPGTIPGTPLLLRG